MTAEEFVRQGGSYRPKVDWLDPSRDLRADDILVPAGGSPLGHITFQCVRTGRTVGDNGAPLRWHVTALVRAIIAREGANGTTPTIPR